MTEDRKTSIYRKIEFRTWSDSKFMALSPLPPCGQGLWFFLLTGPHTRVIPGVFRTGMAAMAEELNWPMEAFREAFREVLENGMVKADTEARLIWLPNALKYNKPASPNVVKGWSTDWDSLPECDLLIEVYESIVEQMKSFGDSYLKAFVTSCREPVKPSGKPSGKPSRKTCLNQEQEQEQYQEQEQEQKKTCGEVSPHPSVPPNGRTAFGTDHNPEIQSDPAETRDAIIAVFDHWRQVMDHPQAKLTADRRKLIRRWLVKNPQVPSPFTAEQLRDAIDGCKATPFNMGQNDRNTVYDDLSVVFRSVSNIERFIRTKSNPPASGGSRRAANLAAVRAFNAQFENEVPDEKIRA